MKILITGGSRGIGRACVERFSKEGHEVAFLYKSNHSAANELKEKYGALPFCVDVSVSQEVQTATEAAIEALGGVDVLINNAGVAQTRLFTDISNDDWNTVLGTNLSGSFYVTRAVLKHMISQKSGRIINIGSMWGKTGASCETHYSASKAGLRGLTMALAKEVGPSGITVNAIEPGVIRTDMNAQLDESALNELCDQTPLCRIGEPEDVANLAYFLASDEASFITGQIIGVDGGFAV